MIEAMKAADELAKENIHIRVLDPFTLKPIDKEAIITHAKACRGKILTVEDHYIEGKCVYISSGERALQHFRVLNFAPFLVGRVGNFLSLRFSHITLATLSFDWSISIGRPFVSLSSICQKHFFLGLLKWSGTVLSLLTIRVKPLINHPLKFCLYFCNSRGRW